MSERVPTAFVWAVWGILLAAALAAIAIHGRNIPLAEDWFMVAPLTGHEPDLAWWVWAQNNEHRLPFPKLLYLLLLDIAGGDFRVGMVFNALALGALAAGSIVTARRLRGGRNLLSDAFFPLVLLHLGHWPNLVWGWQIQYVVSVVLTVGILLVVVGALVPAPGAAIAAGLCLALLPLTGANGLIMALAMVPWAAYAAWRSWRVREGRRRISSVSLATGAILAVALSGAYFVGYQRPPWNPPSPGIRATVRTGAKFVASSLGPAALDFWHVAVLIVAGVMLAATALLVVVLRRGLWKAEAARFWGLVFYLGGLAALVLAVGWGRSGIGGMPHRYALLAVPLLLFAYFLVELYGASLTRCVIRTSLFVIMLLLLPLNFRASAGWREWYREGTDAVQHDLATGLPFDSIAHRHSEFLLRWDRPGLPARMRMLRDAGIGPFGQAAED